MTPEADAAYVSSPQAAQMLGITGVGVAQLIRQGRIPAVKIANRWLIPRSFIEEFALTYEGRRGRPRKPGRRGRSPAPAVLAVETAGEPGAADTAAAPVAPVEEVAAVAPIEARPPQAAPVAAAAAEGAVVEGPRAEVAPARVAEAPQAEAAPARVAAGSETGGVARAPEEEREGGAAFRVSAEVYHLDPNYDFEVYEKGRITDRARIIVARLKPRIPSLPLFSFRWDYRYEHLNVDIQGVEPSVAEWWTMGQNGYTGHLPRRLEGPGYVFEAIIWLPVTFVFRGRLSLSGGSAGVEQPPSTPATTGGLKRLWNRWPGKPRS